jgi:hypothetical protein
MTLVFFALAVFSPLIHLYASKLPKTKENFVNLYFKYFLFWVVGISSIVAFSGHAFIPDQIARDIGWPTGSPFQFEVAMANLAFGVLGLMSLKFDHKFALATLIGWGIFLFGDGIGHVIQLQKTGDRAEYNAGFIMYSDFIFPIIGLILYFLYVKICKSTLNDSN